MAYDRIAATSRPRVDNAAAGVRCLCRRSFALEITRIRIATHPIAFMVLCGALAGLPALSIDMSMPAFPVMSAALHVPGAHIALTLTVFFAGFAFAPLLYGPLSDRVGRRPVLIVGCLVYAVASVLCASAQSINALLVWRLLQGMSAGAASVLVLSLVRDGHDGPRARTLLAYIAAIRLVGPILAPSLGALALTIASWRWIYGFMAIGAIGLFLAVLLGLEESAPRFTKADEHKPTSIARSYVTLLSTPTYIGYTSVIACGFGSHLAYVTGSSLVMMETFHLGPDVYAILFGVAALSIMAASFLSGRLSALNVSGTGLMLTGLATAALSATTMTAITLAGFASVATITFFLVLNCFAFGLIMPNAQQAALQPVPSIAGAASALLNALAMGAGTLASFCVESLFGALGVLALAGLMALFSSLALLAFLATLWWERAHGPASIASARA